MSKSDKKNKSIQGAPPPQASPSISTAQAYLMHNSHIVTDDNNDQTTDDYINSTSEQSSGPPSLSLSHDSTHSGISDRYTVASHTIRITKHGFAIDPIELKNHDIIGHLSLLSRRKSEFSFDSNQVGHKMLAIIRGFWSQPGFPKGKIVRLDFVDTLESIFNEFSKNPPYPHKETFGNISLNRVNFGKNHRKSSSINNKSNQYLSPTTTTTNNQIESNNRSENLQTTDDTSSFLNLSLPSTKQPTLSNHIQAVKSISSSQTKKSSNNSINTSSLLSSLFGSSTASFITSPSNASSSSSKQQLSSNKSGKSKSPSSKSKHQHSSSSSSSLSSKNKNKNKIITIQLNEFISWIPKDKEEIFNLISSLCKKMQKIFSKEDRIINITSPCLVLGDIHGNLIDLRTYERSLWSKAPNCLNKNYLFLGDYVDRGDFSVECVLYLFSMKLLSPNRFFLLRGNHEVATIQRQYTFSRECDIKFGPLGRQIWKNFNKVFDLMPLAAIVDNSIFCAHGGIPRSISDLKKLTKEIPTPLDNPEVQCPSAWEILWNDPITDSELIQMIEMDNTTNLINQSQSDSNNADDNVDQQQQQESNQSMNSNKSDDNYVSEADAILSRQPAASTLSFYIRPAEDNKQEQSTASVISNSQISATSSLNQQQQIKVGQETNSTSNKNEIVTTKDPTTTTTTTPSPKLKSDSQINDNKLETSAAAAAAAAAASLTEDTNQNNSNTLRKYPSDTSSIASTSPQQIINDGFVANIKRGTAFLFSDQAINNFLKLNNLTHVIRAHEVIPTGFAFHGDGRVITIFSSSKYCGLNNQAACVLIDQNKIRILRLDTGETGE